jgi:hypothetical protein
VIMLIDRILMTLIALLMGAPVAVVLRMMGL